MAAVSAPTLLGLEEPILYSPGKDDSASTRIVGLVTPSHRSSSRRSRYCVCHGTRDSRAPMSRLYSDNAPHRTLVGSPPLPNTTAASASSLGSVYRHVQPRRPCTARRRSQPKGLRDLPPIVVAPIMLHRQSWELGPHWSDRRDYRGKRAPPLGWKLCRFASTASFIPRYF